MYDLNGKDLCGERVIVEHTRGPRRDGSYGGSGRSKFHQTNVNIGISDLNSQFQIQSILQQEFIALSFVTGGNNVLLFPQVLHFDHNHAALLIMH